MAAGFTDTHETIEYKNDLPIKLFCQRIGFVEKHWHRSTEILLVLSGVLNVRIENQQYTLKENDVLLINSDQVHDTGSEDCVLVLLQMRLSRFHIDWLAPENIYFDCNSALQKNNPAFDQIREIIARMIKINSASSPYSQLLCLSQAYQMLYVLLTHFVSHNPGKTRPLKQMERLKHIIRFVEENYQRDISLPEIAEREGLTPPYLSSFFEKNMNSSLTSYIAKIRLNHSFHYLLDTDMSIEEISSNCGFPSQRSYATLFKKQYGMLPSLYRKEYNTADQNMNTLSMNSSTHYLNLEKYDFYEKLSTYLRKSEDTSLAGPAPKIYCSPGTVPVAPCGKPLYHNFLSFCSAGRAKELLIGKVQDMLRTQQEEIGFQYIKFHDIFDDGLMVYKEDSQGQPVLNFNMTDEVFDFLLSIRLKPLVQLSFMPAALAKDPGAKIFSLPFCISEPKDNEKWAYLVKSFVHHLLLRYGQREVSEWIFTFWNETMTGHPFDFKDVDTFLRLYKTTYDSVKSCSKDLRFASTSYAGSRFPTENYNRFLDFALQNGCSPDVYLFHFYPMPSGFSRPLSDKGYTNLSLALSGMISSDRDSFGNYLKLLNENLPERDKRPLYITEWNLSSSHRELLNDTCYASAYIIRNICRNYDLVQGFGHWTLTDWIEELDFPKELFHGGVGYFTKNGIKKPMYYAYQFLSQLGNELLAEGEGYFITRGDDDYRLLLYNYCEVADAYLEGFNFSMGFTERYNVFVDASNKEFRLDLSELAPGGYHITEKIVNRHYGSCYDKWVEMGALPITSKEETETLKDLSRPLLRLSRGDCEGGILHYHAELEPHEIRLVIIRKSYD